MFAIQREEDERYFGDHSNRWTPEVDRAVCYADKHAANEQASRLPFDVEVIPVQVGRRE